MALVVKNLPANAGEARDSGSIPESGRSPGGGHGNPLQYSCLENPVDRGARWATVHGVTESQTRLKQLSIHACSPVKFDFLRLEKAKEPIPVEAYNRCLVKGFPTHRAQKVTKIQRS